MKLSTESLDLIIRTLAKRLFTDKNSIIRIKAAQSLAKLATEKAIPTLCQALEIEADLNVSFAIMDAIIIISNLQSSNLMSETSKYDLRGANIANFADTVQGDQKAVQHNYATPQNLAEAAQEIQQLISQLTQTYPTNTEVEKKIFVAQIDAEIKKNSRLRSILITGGIELIKILCPPLGIPIEMGKKWLETANLSE
ncbi:HEAT repeat domain-containing protein [Microcystis sp. M113S1]|jgi:hypothetical protein|uniref:HEAT repeat domain-containing protein n=1 Tax=Microcystis sp. M113S1 TaxID=2771104 RepID=UPI002590B2EE|nr:HEAT repeat domain-containing protein [Microcystis sp. M113S1]